MSSTMRKTGKRTLAGIAAGALGLALIPFVGAGVSQAVFSAGGVAAAAAGNNYVVTAGTAPASTAITVTAGSTVTLNFSVTADNTSATSTIQVLNDATPVDLTLVGGGDVNYVQTNETTITVTETNGTTTASATFTAPAAGAADWSVAFSDAALTDAAITSVANGVSGVTVTAPTAVRANTDTSIATAFTPAIDETGLCVAAISTPLGATFAAVGTGPQSTGAVRTPSITVPGSSITIPGSYSLAFYAQVPSTNTGCVDLTNQPVLATATLAVGGAVANVSITPTSNTAAIGQTAGYAVVATDAAGVRTLFGGANANPVPPMPAQSYTLSSDSATATLAAGGVTSPAGGSISNATATTFTASNSAAATTTITLTPNAGATAATATLSTATTINADTVQLVDPVQGDVADNANPTRTTAVPTGTSSLTFRVTAATAGTVGYSVSGPAATATTGTVVIPASLTADVTVPVTRSTAANTAVTFATTGTARTVVIDIVAPTVAAGDVTLPSAVVAAVGGTVTLSGIVQDSYDRPVPGASIGGVVTQAGGGGTPSQPVSVVTDASGAFTLTWSAASVTATTQSQAVFINVAAPGVASFRVPGNPNTIPVTFTAAGTATVSDLVLGTDQDTPAEFLGQVVVPFEGFVGASLQGDNAADVGSAVELNVTTAPVGVNVTYSSDEGLFVLTSGATTLWSAGESSITVPSTTSVIFYSLKTGANTIKVTAGGNELSTTLTVRTPPEAARSIEVTPESERVTADAITPVRVKVTDVFGNGVPGVQTATDISLGASVSGVGLLNGFNISLPTLGATDANGETAFTYVSQVLGTGIVTVTATGTAATSQFGTGNGAGLINGAIVPGAPAGVTTGTATFEVAPTGASIMIEGFREGRRILVEGVTTGLDAGTVVRPWVRFPGQTSYTQGVAQRQVSATGDFTWQRNTGKRTAVYFLTEAGDIRSDRVIIPAR